MNFVLLVKDLRTEFIAVYDTFYSFDDAQAEMERAMTEWEEPRSFKIAELSEM